MPDPRYTSTYTGQQVESAITKALQIDDFAYVEDAIVGSKVYHILWKVKPTASNTVSGFTVDPSTGDICQAISIEGVIAIHSYLSENDSMSSTDIDNIFN